MAYRFGKTSLERLSGVHPRLQRLMHRAIQLTEVDFSISQGLRTLRDQQNLYAKGRTRAQLDAKGLTHINPAPGPAVTWTLNSTHLFGQAVDVAALPHGVLSWNEMFYAQIADAVRQAARELNIAVTWGGVWDTEITRIGWVDLMDAVREYKARYEAANPGKKAKLDLPHFELAQA